LDIQHSSVIAFKPDLRAAKGTTIQKGLAIRILRVITLISLDITSITLAWEFAILYGVTSYSPWTESLSFLLLNIIVQIGIIFSKDLYKSGFYRRNYIDLIKSVSLSVLILLLITFLYEPNNYISRSTFLLFWLLSITFICGFRFLFDVTTEHLRNRGAFRHPVFIITDTENKHYHIQVIQQNKCYTIQGTADSKCLDLSNRESTLTKLQNLGIEEVFVSWDSIQNRQYIYWHFHSAGIAIRILPTNSESHHPKSVSFWLGETLCETIPSPVVIGADFWVKRIFDLCCSIILIFFLSPILLLIALMIKLDSPGSIFFRQTRIGLHNNEFKIWKFRTMVVNAEKLQTNLEAKNEVKDGVLFKMKDDPRITRVGKFLRCYSLDELPQLFNVLLGEMSLVGPRPLPTRDVEKFQTKHFIRQEVLPGITGLWQVSGRSDIETFEDAVKLDISYIENWSIWLDLKILLKTVKVVLKKTGAY
jgi:exopolysaccharide biosynthesis polyprenyl glycosylphosphotransferase